MLDAGVDQRLVFLHIANEHRRTQLARVRELAAAPALLQHYYLHPDRQELLQHAKPQMPEPAENDVIAIRGSHDAHPFLLPLPSRDQQQREAHDALANENETEQWIEPADQRDRPGGRRVVKRLRQHRHPAGVKRNQK